MTVTITLPPVASPVDQLWHVLLDLGEQLHVPWTLVGGQMVLLHALEHGRVPPQISQYGDMVTDIRAQPGALGTVVDALDSLNFEIEGISADGIGHRYVRPAEPRAVVVDVLAPEGLGDRADLTTTPPGRTLQMPAGTQALSRSETVTVVHEGRSGSLPRPVCSRRLSRRRRPPSYRGRNDITEISRCCARWWSTHSDSPPN